MKHNFRFACCGLLLGIAVTHAYSVKGTSAEPQSAADGQKRCDYTYVQDAGSPNIGKNGQIEYDESWKPVVEGGWTLKATVGGGSNAMYIFEKCR